MPGTVHKPRRHHEEERHPAEVAAAAASDEEERQAHLDEIDGVLDRIEEVLDDPAQEELDRLRYIETIRGWAHNQPSVRHPVFSQTEMEIDLADGILDLGCSC